MGGTGFRGENQNARSRHNCGAQPRLRASEASALNVGDWNGKLLTVSRFKGQNVWEVPLSREARGRLKDYLKWRRREGGMFEVTPESPMFLCQDPRNVGQRLGYKDLHKMVKGVGTIAGVDKLNPNRFRHTFGTEVTRKGVDPLFGKELVGIRSDRVFQRYTKGVFKQVAVEAYLRVIGEDNEEKNQRRLSALNSAPAAFNRPFAFEWLCRCGY